jgi:hypothetical protein
LGQIRFDASRPLVVVPSGRNRFEANSTSRVGEILRQLGQLARLTGGEHTFHHRGIGSQFTDDRLEHARTHDAYGGERSDRGQLLRDLVDEIRGYRHQLADILGDND